LESTLESHLAREAETIAAASGSAEGEEGIASFVQKRKPRFTHG
jgi:enoyl-CoA hydratase/carnithine racemase